MKKSGCAIVVLFLALCASIFVNGLLLLGLGAKSTVHGGGFTKVERPKTFDEQVVVSGDSSAGKIAVIPLEGIIAYGASGALGDSMVEDLKAAIPVVLKESGRQKAHFYGTSSGGIRAAAYAQAQPQAVDRLVICAFTYKGNGAAEIERRRKRIDALRASPRRRRDADMIRSIFTRDGHPPLYDPAVPEAIIAAEMKFGDTIPSGTYLDMAANLPIVDPVKIKSPVLMLRGEFDGNSTNDDLLDFYRQLPNGDRQFVILPQTAHSVGYSTNRHLLWYAMRSFLAAPAPIA